LKPWQKLSLASLEESEFGSIVPSTGIFFLHYSQTEDSRKDENFIGWFSLGGEFGTASVSDPLTATSLVPGANIA
jgi:hypothetical protein